MEMFKGRLQKGNKILLISSILNMIYIIWLARAFIEALQSPTIAPLVLLFMGPHVLFASIGTLFGVTAYFLSSKSFISSGTNAIAASVFFGLGLLGGSPIVMVVLIALNVSGGICLFKEHKLSGKENTTHINGPY